MGDTLDKKAAPDYALQYPLPDLVFRVSRDGTVRRSKAGGGEALSPVAGDVLSGQLHEAMPEEAVEEATAMIAQAFETGDSQSFWYQTGTGAELRDFQAVLSAGEDEGVVVMVSEVSTRRQMYEQLLQAQKMEAVGHLAGGVAHDFNNLLTAIMGHCQLGMLAGDTGAMPESNLREIQRAAERGADLVRRLMTFSRRQAAQAKVVDLNGLVKNTTELLQSLIGEDIELVVSPRPDIGMAKADPGQMEMVLVNLAVNARDAMPDGGTLTVETANVEVDEQHDLRPMGAPIGDYVALYVSDDGVGMAPDIVQHAFEPFFTTKGPKAGTGLGLSTCRTIVSQYDGHIMLSSLLGTGTTVQVYLPRVYEEPGQEPPAAEEPRMAEGGHETVLLVEDEQTVRSVAAAILRDQGYTVVEAGDGVEAVMLARHHHSTWIDLLVTDVVMPIMGGSELVDLLRLTHPDVPVIYMSGYGIESIRRRAVYEDDTSFLTKPFTAAELTQKVRATLGRPAE